MVHALRDPDGPNLDRGSTVDVANATYANIIGAPALSGTSRTDGDRAETRYSRCRRSRLEGEEGDRVMRAWTCRVVVGTLTMVGSLAAAAPPEAPSRVVIDDICVDPEAAQVVFQGGCPLTMVGLEIGRKALFRRSHLTRLQKTHGSQNGLAARVLECLVNLCEKKYGLEGAPVYDPTAMGAVIERSLISTQLTHVAMDIDAERFLDLLITRLAGQ
jgi:hypothetical protein